MGIYIFEEKDSTIKYLYYDQFNLHLSLKDFTSANEGNSHGSSLSFSVQGSGSPKIGTNENLDVTQIYVDGNEITLSSYFSITTQDYDIAIVDLSSTDKLEIDNSEDYKSRYIAGNTE